MWLVKSGLSWFEHSQRPEIADTCVSTPPLATVHYSREVFSCFLCTRHAGDLNNLRHSTFEVNSSHYDTIYHACDVLSSHNSVSGYLMYLRNLKMSSVLVVHTTQQLKTPCHLLLAYLLDTTSMFIPIVPTRTAKSKVCSIVTQARHHDYTSHRSKQKKSRERISRIAHRKRAPLPALEKNLDLGQHLVISQSGVSSLSAGADGRGFRLLACFLEVD